MPENNPQENLVEDQPSAEELQDAQEHAAAEDVPEKRTRRRSSKKLSFDADQQDTDTVNDEPQSATQSVANSEEDGGAQSEEDAEQPSKDSVRDTEPESETEFEAPASEQHSKSESQPEEAKVRGANVDEIAHTTDAGTFVDELSKELDALFDDASTEDEPVEDDTDQDEATSEETSQEAIEVEAIDDFEDIVDRDQDTEEFEPVPDPDPESGSKPGRDSEPEPVPEPEPEREPETERDPELEPAPKPTAQNQPTSAPELDQSKKEPTKRQPVKRQKVKQEPTKRQPQPRQKAPKRRDSRSVSPAPRTAQSDPAASPAAPQPKRQDHADRTQKAARQPQRFLRSSSLKQAFRNFGKLKAGAAWRETCWPVVTFMVCFALVDLAVADSMPIVESFNTAVNTAIYSTRGALDTFVIALTTIGDFLPMAALCLVICIFLYLLKKWDSLAYFVTNVALAIVCVQALKLIFAVPRPAEDTLVPLPISFSFPSAHSFCSLVVFGMIGLLIFRALYARGISRKAAMIPGIILIIFAILVGISRIYVGVHWPSDVLGGWLLAGAWLSFAGALYTAGARQN